MNTNFVKALHDPQNKKTRAPSEDATLAPPSEQQKAESSRSPLPTKVEEFERRLQRPFLLSTSFHPLTSSSRGAANAFLAGTGCRGAIATVTTMSVLTRVRRSATRNTKARAAALLAQTRTAPENSGQGVLSRKSKRSAIASFAENGEELAAGVQTARKRASSSASSSSSSSGTPFSLLSSTSATTATAKKSAKGKKTRAPLGKMKMFAGGKWRRERLPSSSASAGNGGNDSAAAAASGGGGNGGGDELGDGSGKAAGASAKKVYRCPLCPNEPPYA